MLKASASQQGRSLVPIMTLQNVGAYVVGDHYTAPWEFPATKKYMDKGANYMQALQSVLLEQGEH